MNRVMFHVVVLFPSFRIWKWWRYPGQQRPRALFVCRLAVAAMVMIGAVVSLDFAWSFAGFIIYIFLLTHNNIKHHHQHETYGEADGAEIAVLAA